MMRLLGAGPLGGSLFVDVGSLWRPIKTNSNHRPLNSE